MTMRTIKLKHKDSAEVVYKGKSQINILILTNIEWIKIYQMVYLSLIQYLMCQTMLCSEKIYSFNLHNIPMKQVIVSLFYI